ncbi:hypothetical protein [Sulfurimonas sp. HSL-1716]|uniref:hypothetical protein n=1 Tax=Hydrocurvibacter sulfurireducens TaxID=3131937 RepID=UPI0031F9F829
MKKYLILFLILGLDALFLLYETSQLSIGYSEVTLLNGGFSVLKYIEEFSLATFGQNDVALRLPMILLHLSSALLLFHFSKKYLKYDRDRLWLLVVFILLPGVLSSSIVVNSAGLVIFSLFLYLNLYSINPYFKYLLLVPIWFVSPSIIFLYLGLMFYAIKEKNYRFALLNLFLFSSSLYVNGFDTTGLPKGHFLDTLAIYSAIFTPIVFVYIFYILYRRYVTSREDILWYISSTAFMISLLLSFRQRLHLENFAPYILLALPIAAQTFYHSYRVRLKQFRGTYKTIFIISLLFLSLNATMVLFNKYIYCFLDDPQEHFAYDMHIAKDLAEKLKEKNIACVNANNKKLQLRLKFYEIGYCQGNTLSKIKHKDSINVTISYKGCKVYKTYVTKINK